MSINLQKNHDKIEGNWWDPSNPAERWYGELIMKAGNNASLRLVEYGKSYLNSGLNRFRESSKIIHGLTKDGKAVTLSESYLGARSMSSGSNEIRVEVGQIIFGHHFLAEDMTFEEVQVEFDYLRDWITYSRFEMRDVTDQENQKEVRIRLNQNHQFPFEVPEYSKGLLYIGYTSRYSAFKYSIESQANVQIKYHDKKTLNEILKDLRQWAWFLTLGTRHETHLMSLTVYRDDLRFKLGEKSFRQPLDVWGASSGKRKNRKNLHPPQMCFSMPDIQNDLSAVISRWKAMQGPWAAVLHRYFATNHRNGIQLHEQFLFRAQALEAMCRSTDPSHKVSQRLAYGSAWEKASDVLKENLGEKEAFVEAVRINRNYLTHYSPEDEKKSADFGRLFDLTQKLGYLIESLILAEIGIPGAIIEKAMNPRYWPHPVQFDSID